MSLQILPYSKNQKYLANGFQKTRVKRLIPDTGNVLYTDGDAGKSEKRDASARRAQYINVANTCENPQGASAFTFMF